MAALREMLSLLDSRPVQTRANLAAYGGEFYRIGDEEWCDTASESYRRVGPDQWVASESLPAMTQPGMNTGEGESPESSAPFSRGDVGSNPTGRKSHRGRPRSMNSFSRTSPTCCREGQVTPRRSRTAFPRRARMLDRERSAHTTCRTSCAGLRSSS
jgi:hypothetical protein